MCAADETRLLREDPAGAALRSGITLHLTRRPIPDEAQLSADYKTHLPSRSCF